MQVESEIRLGCVGRLVDHIHLAFPWSTAAPIVPIAPASISRRLASNNCLYRSESFAFTLLFLPRGNQRTSFRRLPNPSRLSPKCTPRTPRSSSSRLFRLSRSRSDILHPGHLPPGQVEKVKRKSAKSPYFFSSVARLGRGQQASTASPPLSGRVHLPSRPHPAHRERDPTRSESVGEFLVAPNTRVMPAPLPNRSSPT